MSVSKPERAMVAVAKAGNDIIGVDIVTNGLTILAKAVLLRSMSAEEKTNSHLYKYLDSKSYGRCVIHMLPIIGKTVTDVYDDVKAAYQRKKAEKIALVGQNGLNLERCGRFRNSKDVVMHAVLQNGLALRFARTRLRGDRDLVYHACANNPAALQYADKNIQREMIAQFPEMLHYADGEIRAEYDREQDSSRSSLDSERSSTYSNSRISTDYSGESVKDAAKYMRARLKELKDEDDESGEIGIPGTGY